MKALYMLGLAALLLGAGFMAGCLDEVLDPKLDFSVVEVTTNSTSPNPGGEPAGNGSHWVYVKVDVTNKNEKEDLTIGPASFYADDNVTEYTGSYLANGSSLRRIDTLRIDASADKTFWVVFGRCPMIIN